MKILKILIILLLIVLPLGELARFTVAKDIAIKPLDIISGAIFLTGIVLLIKKKTFLRKFKPLIFFPLIGLTSLFINSFSLQLPQFFVAFLYLFRWISYASLFPVVWMFDKKFKKTIQQFLLIDGFIVVIAGFIQYFFYPDLHGLFHFGWDIHMYRLFSTFLDPNFTGAFLALYALFIVGIIWSYAKVKRYKASLPYILILLATIIAVFLTYSRSALSMFIVGFIIFFILINKKKFILVLLSAVVVFALVISPFFYLENINLFRRNSSVARVDNYSVAFKIFQEHPLFGVGFNRYRYAKDAIGIQSEWTNAPSHADAGVDNSLLFVLATTGVVGFFAYISMWFTFIKQSYLLYKKQMDITAIVILASIGGLFINSFFINSLFYPAIMLWMWILLGFIKPK